MNALSLTYNRREWIIELLLLLAESVLIWMAAATLFAPFVSAPAAVSPLLVLGLVAVAEMVPRTMHDRGFWGWRYSLAISVALMLSTLAAIKFISFPGLPWFDSFWPREALRSLVFEESGTDMLVWAPIGLNAAIWWLARFHESPGLERSRMTLRAGAAITALVAIAAGLVEHGPTDHALTVAIIVFFTVTLIALAITRQGNEATRSRSRLWSTVILPALVIGIVAIFGAFVVVFDWRDALPRAFPAAERVLDPVFGLLALLLTGIVFIIALPIMWLLSLGNYQPPKIAEFGSLESADATHSVFGWQPPDPVRYLLAFIVLVLIFFGLVRFALSITRRAPERDETGERVYGSGKGFGKWLERLRWPFGRDQTDPLAGLRGDPVWAQTVRVREIYADWLRWAERHKADRDPAETAHEFDQRSGPLLRHAVSVAALDELTAIYEDVRYGHVPATTEQAERAANAWRRLKTSESMARE